MLGLTEANKRLRGRRSAAVLLAKAKEIRNLEKARVEDMFQRVGSFGTTETRG